MAKHGHDAKAHTDVGFDPVKWIERLMNVNEDSGFIEADKCTIAAELNRLRERLIAERQERVEHRRERET